MAKKGDILTPKQLHYARCVASGMSQSDAYREAYAVTGSTPKTVNEKASRLMAQDKIRARVDALVALREKAFMRSSAGTKAKVLAKLEEFMESAEPSDAVRLRATELLGKSIGLFKDVVEDVSNRTRSSEELKAELKERLEQLLNDEADDGESPTIN